MKCLKCAIGVAVMLALFAPALTVADVTAERLAADKAKLQSECLEYLETLMHEPAEGEPWGLFRYSKEDTMPYSIVATADAWGVANLAGGIEKLPGYHPKAREELAAFIQKFQEPDTGLFRDPYLDKRFAGTDDAREAYRRAVTKYAIGLLSVWGAEPLHPYTYSRSETGEFDPQAYLSHVKGGDWTQPYGLCSQVCLETLECYRLVSEGRQDLIPVLKEGITVILSHQNPETGMWGPATYNIHQQAGGALKTVARFQWGMGLIVPHMDRLADSIIKHHRSRAFYEPKHSASQPRNVALLARDCLAVSDYRRDELRQVLVEVIDELKSYAQPGGGFSYSPSGTGVQNWCGAQVAGPSQTARGDVHGTINIAHTLFMIYDLLLDDRSAARHWQKVTSKLEYKVWVDAAGNVQVEPRQPAKN